jgi:predicted PurR-regulated permease PerM
MTKFQENFKQIIFFIVIICLAVLLFVPLRVIFAGFLGACTLYILNYKFVEYLNGKKNWNIYLVTFLLMFGNILVLLIPSALAVVFVLPKLNTILTHSNEFITGIKQIIIEIETRFDVEILSVKNLEKLPSVISATLPEILGTISSFLLNISAMFFMLYYMLVNTKKIEKAMKKSIPLKPENLDSINQETRNIITSYAIGIPVISCFQGVAAAIGYAIFGVPDVLLWGFLTAIVAIIPFIGTSLIALPLIAYLFAIGETYNAIGLLIYTGIVVMQIDNLLRLFLLKAFANIHPLITLCGVIVGLKLFGFIGLIFGPLLVSYFILLIKIYNIEFAPSKRHSETNHSHSSLS